MHVTYSLEFLPGNQTPIFFVKKSEFVNNSWIFYTPIMDVLRIYLST